MQDITIGCRACCVSDAATSGDTSWSRSLLYRTSPTTWTHATDHSHGGLLIPTLACCCFTSSDPVPLLTYKRHTVRTCILNTLYASACITMSWCVMYVAEGAIRSPTFRVSCFSCLLVVGDHGKHVNDVKAKVFEAEPAVAIKQDEKYQTRGFRVSRFTIASSKFPGKSLNMVYKYIYIIYTVYIPDCLEIKECFLGTCDFCVCLAKLMGQSLADDAFKWVRHPLAVGSCRVKDLHLLHVVEWSCHHLTPFALSTGPWRCNSSWPRRNVSRIRIWWW